MPCPNHVPNTQKQTTRQRLQISPAQDHHAVISADDHASLTHGTADEINVIGNRPLELKYRGDITLVFVRNLMMYRQDLKDSVAKQKIAFDKKVGILRRNDKQYLVSGIVDNKYVHLVQVEADDALMAIKYASRQIVTQPDVAFIPLEVSMIHPSTQECYNLFDSAAARVKALIEVHSDKAGYRQ
jgi:hypothetical protein